MTHNIRLHGPWQCEFPESGAPSQTIRIPCDLRDVIGQPPHGGVRLQRKFNLPTGLEAGQAVTLVFEEVNGVDAVLLNGELLPLHGRGETGVAATVTTLLGSSNVISVSLAIQNNGELPCGIKGEVRLEIAEDDAAV